MSSVGAIINVKGMVQGVGFRWWTQRKADEYDVRGYVSNLPDGTVEVEAEGDRGVVEEFIKELKAGPSSASVNDLDIKWYNQPKGHTDFRIKR